MNGKEKTQLQIDRGTRPIVVGVDSLRVTFGFDKVEVLTPIVETRLRSGLLAARDLKVSISSPYGSILVTIPMGFPLKPVDIEVELKAEFQGNESQRLALEESIQSIVTEQEQHLYVEPHEAVGQVIQSLCRIFGQLELTSAATPAGDSSPMPEYEDELVHFCCRRCRTPLFDTTMLHEHHTSLSARCTSLFLEEPLPFISTKEAVSEGKQEGKILCPKCDNRVGNWSWIGSACSCGEWIVPAYQFTRSKLDEKKE